MALYGQFKQSDISKEAEPFYIRFSSSGEMINVHAYHYAGNNPVKYMDPDGEKDRPAIAGISGPLPLFNKEINTGSNNFDSFLAGSASVWNAAASVVNAPFNYAGALLNASDNLVTQLDNAISDEYSLTGQGLKEDLFVGGLFAGMNPGVVTGAVQSGKNAVPLLKNAGQGIVNSLKPPTFENVVANSKSFADIEKAFFDVASPGAAKEYNTLKNAFGLKPNGYGRFQVNDGTLGEIIKAYWKTFVNPD